MDAMAPQITSASIVYSTVVHAQMKKKSKLRVTGLCEGNSPDPAIVHLFDVCMIQFILL